MLVRMSQRDLDRLGLMGDILGGRLSQKEAAHALDLSTRQVRRIVRRFQREGAKGLVHRSRGRPSNRKICKEIREEVAGFMREPDFHDYGPTLLSESLAQERGIEVSRETMRKWMILEERWKPRKAKVHHRQWRERKACHGEMIQMDTSIHDWFEGRGEEAVVIAMIDDATSRLYCQFFTTDSTATNMTLLRDYIRRNGRPRSLYVDKASHFMTTRCSTPEEQRQGKKAQTQIQRALQELDVKHVTAHSPQAKGRVERCFRTLQDRLVKAMRRAKIATIEQANAYLEEVFLPFWQERYTEQPREVANVHRSRKGFDLNAIFSRQETRRVADDYTFSCHGQHIQILSKSIAAGLRRSRVTIEERLDGTRKVRWRGRYLRTRQLPRKMPKPKARIRPSTDVKGKVDTGPRPHKPPHDHPWRHRAIFMKAKGKK